MGIKSIKIVGDNTPILSVGLNDVLSCIDHGSNFNWVLLWLEGVGNISSLGTTMLELERLIKNSDSGFIVEWPFLMEFSNQVDQLIEVTLIGVAPRDNIRKFTNDEEMYQSCDYTIELIDSSYWIIHSNHEKELEKMKLLLPGTEWL